VPSPQPALLQPQPASVGLAPTNVANTVGVPLAASDSKKRGAPADNEKAAAKACKLAQRAAKQTAKQDEREARETTKAIGDAIKEGMRLPAEPGSLVFRNVRPPVFSLMFADHAGVGGTAAAAFPLTQRQLVAIFGTTKIEKGGSRDHRYVCERAQFRYDAAGAVLRVDYHPKHTGSGVWWRNR